MSIIEGRAAIPSRKRVSLGIFKLSYLTMGQMLVIDQLLLPMLRVGSISFKVSYFICGIWLLHWFQQTHCQRDEIRDIVSVFSVFSLIIGCIILGELWLSTIYPVDAHYEALRSIISYIFCALAFGLGRTVRDFNLNWLIPILFTAIGLNIIFIYFHSSLPGWLINFYYPERALADWGPMGITTIEAILELSRPRGLFGNPNASMLLVNIILLFITLGLRNKMVTIKSHWVSIIIIWLPLILSLILGSRGEFIVSSTLGVLNFRELVRQQGHRLMRSLIGVLLVVFLFIGVGVSTTIGELSSLESLNRIGALLNEESQENSNNTIARPLNQLDITLHRFLNSPVFGTGISSAKAPIFSEGTQYYHNDWFMLLTTAGIIGFMAMVWLFQRFTMSIGWPLIIPFVLPGMVNTFMLNIPAMIFFFFMIGVFRVQLQAKEKIRMG